MIYVLAWFAILNFLLHTLKDLHLFLKSLFFMMDIEIRL